MVGRGTYGTVFKAEVRLHGKEKQLNINDILKYIHFL